MHLFLRKRITQPTLNAIIISSSYVDVGSDSWQVGHVHYLYVHVAVVTFLQAYSLTICDVQNVTLPIITKTSSWVIKAHMLMTYFEMNTQYLKLIKFHPPSVLRVAFSLGICIIIKNFYKTHSIRPDRIILFAKLQLKINLILWRFLNRFTFNNVMHTVLYWTFVQSPPVKQRSLSLPVSDSRLKARRSTIIIFDHASWCYEI